MSNIFFVAKLDSQDLERELNNLGKKIKPVQLPASIAGKIDTSNLEAISVKLDGDVKQFIQATRQEFKNNPIEGKVKIYADPEEISKINSEVDKISKKIETLNEFQSRPGISLDTKEFNRQISIANQKIDELVRERSVLVDIRIDNIDEQIDALKTAIADIDKEINIDLAEIQQSQINAFEDQIKDLTRDREILVNLKVNQNDIQASADEAIAEINNQRIRLKIEPISSFPKIELKVNDDDRKLLLQLSRNPKIKVEQQVLPGITARSGLSFRDGFKTNFNVDFSEIISTVSTSFSSLDRTLERNFSRVISGEKVIADKLQEQTNIQSSSGQSIEQGFFNAVGEQLNSAVNAVLIRLALNLTRGFQRTPLGQTVARGQAQQVEKNLQQQSSGTGTVVTQEVTNLIAKNAQIQTKQSLFDRILDPFKKAFDLFVVRPITNIGTSINQGIFQKVGNNIGDGLIPLIESRISQPLEKVGEIVGNQLERKLNTLTDFTGVTKGREDFQDFVKELISFFDETKEAEDVLSGLQTRFRNNYKKVAADIANNFDATQPSNIQLGNNVQGVTFAAGGFSGKQGKSSNLVASALQNILPNQAVIPIKITNTDTNTSSRDNIPKWLIEALGSTARRNIKGYSPDAVAAAKEAYAFAQANPGVPISAVGYSAGGNIVGEFAEIMKELGVVVKTVTLGAVAANDNVKLSEEQLRSIAFKTDYISQATNLTGSNTQIESIDTTTLTDNLPIPKAAKDIINAILPIGFSHDFKKYVVSPEVQNTIQEFIEGSIQDIPDEIQKEINLVVNNALQNSFDDFYSQNLRPQATVEASKINATFTRQTNAIASALNQSQQTQQFGNQIEQQLQEPSVFATEVARLQQVEAQGRINDRAFAEKLIRIQASKERMRQRRIAKLQEQIQQQEADIQRKIDFDKQLTGINIPTTDTNGLLPSGILVDRDTIKTQVGINREAIQKSFAKTKKEQPSQLKLDKLEATLRLVDDEINKLKILLNSDIDQTAKDYIKQYALPSLEKDQRIKGKLNREITATTNQIGINRATNYTFANRDSLGLNDLKTLLNELIANVNFRSGLSRNQAQPPQAVGQNNQPINITEIRNPGNQNPDRLLSAQASESLESIGLNFFKLINNIAALTGSFQTSIESAIDFITRKIAALANLLLYNDTIDIQKRIKQVKDSIKSLFNFIQENITRILGIATINFNDLVAETLGAGGELISNITKQVEKIPDILGTKEVAPTDGFFKGTNKTIARQEATKDEVLKNIDRINAILDELPKAQQEAFGVAEDNIKVLGSGFWSTVIGTIDQRKLAYKFIGGFGSDKEVATLQKLQGTGLAPEIKLLYKDLLVLEQVKGQTLKSLLKDLENKGDTEKAIALVKQAGASFKQLHDLNLTSGDFNFGNVLVDEKGNFKLIDFQFSKSTDSPKDIRTDFNKATNLIANPEYQAAFVAGYGQKTPLRQPSELEKAQGSFARVIEKTTDLFNQAFRTRKEARVNTAVSKDFSLPIVALASQEIAKISLGQNIDNAKIPKLGVLPKEFENAGGAYDISKNTVELAQKYYDILKKDPTTLNAKQTKLYTDALKILIHELRHAAQAAFGVGTAFEEANLSREEFTQKTGIDALKATEAELAKIQKDLEFSTQGKGSTVAIAEQDAYVFAERFAQDIISKILNPSVEEAISNIEDTSVSAGTAIEEELNNIAKLFSAATPEGQQTSNILDNFLKKLTVLLNSTIKNIGNIFNNIGNFTSGLFGLGKTNSQSPVVQNQTKPEPTQSSTVKSQQINEISTIIAEEIASITFGSVNQELIKKLPEIIALPKDPNSKSGGSYLPDTNQIEVTGLDILGRKFTDLSNDEIPLFIKAIEKLAHEIRHGIQDGFGTNKIFDQENLSRSQFSQIAGFIPLKGTDAELAKVQKGLEYSTRKGGETRKIAEEDAYIFVDRYINQILQKVLNKIKTQNLVTPGNQIGNAIPGKYQVIAGQNRVELVESSNISGTTQTSARVTRDAQKIQDEFTKPVLLIGQTLYKAAQINDKVIARISRPEIPLKTATLFSDIGTFVAVYTKELEKASSGIQSSFKTAAENSFKTIIQNPAVLPQVAANISSTGFDIGKALPVDKLVGGFADTGILAINRYIADIVQSKSSANLKINSALPIISGFNSVTKQEILDRVFPENLADSVFSELEKLLILYKKYQIDTQAIPEVLQRVQQIQNEGSIKNTGLAVTEATKELFIAVGGYGATGGSSGTRIARSIGQLTNKETQKAIYVKNKFSDAPKGTEIEFLSQAQVNSIVKANARGYTPDGVEIAAQAIAALQKNPTVTVKILGESGGGFNAEEAAYILEAMGYGDRSTFLGLGTPSLKGGLDTKDRKYTSPDDPLSAFIPTAKRYGLASESQASKEGYGLTGHIYEEHLKANNANLMAFLKTAENVTEKDISSLRKLIDDYESKLTNVTVQEIRNLATSIEKEVGELPNLAENLRAFKLQNPDSPKIPELSNLISRIESLNFKIKTGTTRYAANKIINDDIKFIAQSLSVNLLNAIRNKDEQKFTDTKAYAQQLIPEFQKSISGSKSAIADLKIELNNLIKPGENLLFAPGGIGTRTKVLDNLLAETETIEGAFNSLINLASKDLKELEPLIQQLDQSFPNIPTSDRGYKINDNNKIKLNELFELVNEEIQKVRERSRASELQALPNVNQPANNQVEVVNQNLYQNIADIQDISNTLDAAINQVSNQQKRLFSADIRSNSIDVKSEAVNQSVAAKKKVDRLLSADTGKRKNIFTKVLDAILNTPIIDVPATFIENLINNLSTDKIFDQISFAFGKKIKTKKTISDNQQLIAEKNNNSNIENINKQLQQLDSQGLLNVDIPRFKQAFKDSGKLANDVFNSISEEFNAVLPVIDQILNEVDINFDESNIISGAVNNLDQQLLTKLENYTKSYLEYFGSFLYNSEKLELKQQKLGNFKLKGTNNQAYKVFDKVYKQVFEEITKDSLGFIPLQSLPAVKQETNPKYGGSYNSALNVVKIDQKYIDSLNTEIETLDPKQIEIYIRSLNVLIHELRHGVQFLFSAVNYEDFQKKGGLQNSVPITLKKLNPIQTINDLTNNKSLTVGAARSYSSSPDPYYSRQIEIDAQIYAKEQQDLLFEKIKQQQAAARELKKITSVDIRSEEVGAEVNQRLFSAGGQKNSFEKLLQSARIIGKQTAVNLNRAIDGIGQSFNQFFVDNGQSKTGFEQFTQKSRIAVKQSVKLASNAIADLGQIFNEASTSINQRLQQETKKSSLISKIKDFVFPGEPQTPAPSNNFIAKIRANQAKAVQADETLTNQVIGQQVANKNRGLYEAIGKISPTLATGVSDNLNKIIALKDPVNQLVGSMFRLRGSLNIEQEINSFKNKWEKAYQEINQGANFSNVTNNIKFVDPARFLTNIQAVIKGTTNLKDIPKLVQLASENAISSIDQVFAQSLKSFIKLKSGFELGFNVLSQPVEILENLVNKILPGLGSKVGDIARGFFAFNSIQSAIAGLKQFTTQSVLAFAEFDRLKTSLTFSSGTEAGANQNLKFVLKQVNELKVPLQSALEGYTKLTAAAKSSPLAKEANNLFKGILQASTVLSLSQEQQQGVLTAIQQVISKGVVQSEEIRGQLSERIPGAIGLAARALGVTEIELNKLMKSGLLIASEFIPAFSKQLQREFGGNALDASNNLSSAIYNIQNQFLQFQQITGQAVAPYVSKGLNAIVGALEFVTKNGETATKVIQALVSGFAITNLSALFTAITTNVLGFTALKIAAYALSTALGVITRYIAPLILNFLAFQFALETTTSLFSLFTSKNDISDFADKITKRFKTSANSVNGLNQELKKLSDYRPPTNNIFDGLGRSLDNKDAGGIAGNAIGVVGGGAALAGALAFKTTQAAATKTTAALAAKAAQAGSTAIVAGLAESATVAGLGAGAAAAGTVAAAGIAGAAAGYVINRIGGQILRGDSSFYGYAEKARDDRRVAVADETGKAVDDIYNKGKSYISFQRDPQTGQIVRDPKTGRVKMQAASGSDLEQVQALDKQIENLTARRQVVPETDKARIAELDKQLKDLADRRKQVGEGFLDYQSNLKSTITDLEALAEKEADPQVKAGLESQVVGLKKLQAQLDLLGAKNVDVFVQFARAMERIDNALNQADINAQKFLSTANNLAKVKELGTIGTNVFATNVSAVKQSENQLQSLLIKRQKTQQSLATLNQNLANPLFADLLKEAGLNDNTSIEELKNLLTDIEDKTTNGSQTGTRLKPAIQALIKIREEEQKLQELDLQTTDAKLQIRQTTEQLALATIEENNKKATASNQLAADNRTNALKKYQRDGILTEAQTATAIARIQLSSSEKSLSIQETQLAALRANRSKLSAQEFTNRERDLLSQIAQTRRQVIEQDIEVTKQALANQLTDIEKVYTDSKQKFEGLRAIGKIDAAEFNQQVLTLDTTKADQNIAALQKARKSTKNPEIIRNIDAQIGANQKARLDAIAAFFTAEEARYTTHYDKLQAIEDQRLIRGKTSQARYNQEILNINSARLNSEEALIRKQISQTTDTEQLDKLQAKLAAIAKRRQEATNNYFTAEEARYTTHYDKLQAIVESNLFKGLTNQSQYNQEILNINEQRLNKEQQLIQKQLQATPAIDTEQVERLQTRLAGITKRKLEINKTYYEAEIKQTQDFATLQNTELENQLEKGLTTTQEFNRQKYLNNQQALQAELDLLKQQEANTPANTIERQQVRIRINQVETSLANNSNQFIEDESQRLAKQIEKATAVIKASESERNLAAAQYLAKYKNTVDAQIVADKIRLDAKRVSTQEEVKLEKQRLAALQAISGQITDPRKRSENQSAIAASQQRLADLTIELANNEISLQDNSKRNFERNLDAKTLAQKISSSNIVRSLEREKNSYDAIVNSLQNQDKLLKARGDLAKAQSDFTVANTQIRSDVARRSLDLVKKRDDPNSAPLVVEEAKRQLAINGLNPNISEYDALINAQKIENNLADLKTRQLQAQFELQQAQLEIQNQSNLAAAKRLLIEAQISEVNSRQNVNEANSNLQKAIKSGDQQAIDNAKLSLDLARQQANLELIKLNMAQENLGVQTELAGLAGSLLQTQRATAIAQDDAAKAALQQSQAMERAETAARTGAGFNLFSPLSIPAASVRFQGGEVEAGQPYLIGEDRLTGKISPRHTEIFVPHTSGKIINAYDTQKYLQPPQSFDKLTSGKNIKIEYDDISTLTSQPIVSAINSLGQQIHQLPREQNNTFHLIETDDSVESILKIQRGLMHYR